MDKSDIKEGIITKVNLDREWGLGHFCHRKYLSNFDANSKVEQKLRITFIIGDITFVNR